MALRRFTGACVCVRARWCGWLTLCAAVIVGRAANKGHAPVAKELVDARAELNISGVPCCVCLCMWCCVVAGFTVAFAVVGVGDVHR